VGFLQRDFERDHLAEKSNRTKISIPMSFQCLRPFGPQTTKLETMIFLEIKDFGSFGKSVTH
jgi:hypothetical protein